MGLEWIYMIVGIVVGVAVPLAMIFTLLHVFHLKTNVRASQRQRETDSRLDDVEKRLESLRAEYHARVVAKEGKRGL